MKKNSSLKTMSRYMHGTAGFIILAFIGTAMSIFLSFLSPKIISFAVDHVIGNEKGDIPAIVVRMVAAAGGREFLRSNLWIMVLAMILCAVLGGIASFCSTYFIAKGTETFTKNMRNDLIDHILRLPFSWHNDHQTGNTIQRCTSDVETVRAFISEQLIEVMRTLLLLVIALSFMFPMNTKLTFIFLASIPIIMLYSAFFGSKIGKQFRKADETEGVLMDLVQENLTGVRVVRAFGRERYERERFTKINDRFAKEWIDMGYTSGLFWGVGDFVSVMQIMLIICMGAVFASKGELTLGSFMTFVSYATTLSWPIRDFGHVLSELSKAGVSIDRIREILDYEPEQDNAEATDKFPDGDIRFEHVNFSYGSNEVLHDVSFAIKRGTTVGILGSTGSGKSTLTYLLNRLYELPENSGKISIGGTDIKDIRLSALRENIGLVLQEPFLFSKSIRENIKITAQDADDNAMRSAASIAAIDNDIIKFPHGYDTIVGERGVTLSGGQKQRTAMARTLLKNCPIIVFDDSMSAVDMETDAEIREALHRSTSGTTVIMISHRINTLMLSDNILVIDGGRIVESGTHKELVGKNGLYRKVYDLQAGADDKEGGRFDESFGRKL